MWDYNGYMKYYIVSEYQGLIIFVAFNLIIFTSQN